MLKRLPPLIAAAILAAAAGGWVAQHGAAAAAGAAPSPAARTEGVPRLGPVFVIVGENTSLRQLTSARAPYLVDRLKPRAAWLSGYRALGNSSSLGNYIEMTSGQSIACERNNASPVNLNTDRPACHQNVDNLFHQLQAAGSSWTEWNESMPNACAFYDDGTAWAGNVYSAHHNPAIYYDNIEGDVYKEDYTAAPNATCRTHVLPMGSTAPNDTSTFDAALAAGRVPRFNYIVPNDCQNGHDPCGTTNPLGQFDQFLAREVPEIQASPAYGPNSLIVIVWDEQGDVTPHDPTVGSVWLGPLVRPGVYPGSWTHASLLRTLEDGFRLPHLAQARTAPLVPIWR